MSFLPQIFFDRFIDKDELRNSWNSHCDRLGYIDAFEKKFGHRDAPSTDIRKCPDSMHLVNYVMKYAGKKPLTLPSFRMVDGERQLHKTHYHTLKPEHTNGAGIFQPAQTSKDLVEMRPIDGRMWGCSDALRKLSTPLTGETEALNEAVEGMSNTSGFKIVKKERFTMVFGPVDKYLQEHCPGLWFWWISFHQHQFNRLYGSNYDVKDSGLCSIDIPPDFPESPIHTFVEACEVSASGGVSMMKHPRPELIVCPF